jgi:hypothetical protein
MFKEDRPSLLSGQEITMQEDSSDYLGPLSTNLIATLHLTTVYKKLFVTKLVDVDLMMLQILTVETQALLMDLAEHAKLQ